MGFSLVDVALVDVAVGPVIGALSVFLAHHKVALVAESLGRHELALSMELIVHKIALVRCTVLKRKRCTEAERARNQQQEE